VSGTNRPSAGASPAVFVFFARCPQRDPGDAMDLTLALSLSFFGPFQLNILYINNENTRSSSPRM
jgi:hypothetical protein